MNVQKITQFAMQAIKKAKTLSTASKVGLALGGTGLLFGAVALTVKETIGDKFEKYQKAEVSEDSLATTIGDIEIRTEPKRKIQDARIYTSENEEQSGYVKLQGGAEIKFPLKQTENEGGLTGYGSTHFININDNICAHAVDNLNINTHRDSAGVFVSDCSNTVIDVSEGNSSNNVNVRSWDRQVSNVKVNLGENDKVKFPQWGDSYFYQEYSNKGTYLLEETNLRKFSKISKIENNTKKEIELPPENVTFGGVKFDYVSVKKDKNGKLMIKEQKDKSTGKTLYCVTLENGIVIKYPKQKTENVPSVSGAIPSMDDGSSQSVFRGFSGLKLWGTQTIDEICLTDCKNSDIHVDNDKPKITDWDCYGDHVIIQDNGNSSNNKVHMGKYDSVYKYKDGKEVDHLSNDSKVKTRLYRETD